MRRRRALVALAAVVLASCASLPPAERRAIAPLPDASFALAGRLSARHGNDAVAASFRWQHAQASDELVLATPMGAALAQLSGSREGVRLTLAEGRSEAAADWEALTTRVLGVPLPVAGLAWWIRASPHPASTFSAETDAAGRLDVLRQAGWQVVFAYRDAERRPQRLVLSYPDVEVRIVVDEWLP